MLTLWFACTCCEWGGVGGQIQTEAHTSVRERCVVIAAEEPDWGAMSRQALCRSRCCGSACCTLHSLHDTTHATVETHLCVTLLPCCRCQYWLRAPLCLSLSCQSSSAGHSAAGAAAAAAHPASRQQRRQLQSPRAQRLAARRMRQLLRRLAVRRKRQQRLLAALLKQVVQVVQVVAPVPLLCATSSRRLPAGRAMGCRTVSSTSCHPRQSLARH